MEEMALLTAAAASAGPKESDFQQQQQVYALLSPLTHVKFQVGLVGAATVSVGFVEACLHFDRRPIPLPFAIKYALANTLPSAVWQTVSAEAVAAACSVPSASLITSPSATVSPRARGQRLLQISTLRSVRYIAGSYGLAWSLWRLHTASSTSVEGGDAEMKFVEKVLRLAPQGSVLSEVSKTRHGGHITTLPLASDAKEASNNRVASVVDWASLGLMQRHIIPRVEKRAPSSSGTQKGVIKVVEVELQDTEAVTSTRRAIKRMTSNGATTADAIESGDDATPASASGVRYSDFAQALLCQYSIPSTKLNVDEVLSATGDKSEEQVTEVKAEVASETGSSIVVLVTSTLAEGNAVAQKLIDT
uniref:Uncharacterized protein n=1 Tax=Globisporangium ultimum (strain ATCC 200006 / CBS 805.95 / DAOM BR144) TaxID=431595 RepID=K3WDI9_GLOUD